MTRDTLIRRLATGGVVVAATILSYSTLHHRALVIGIPTWSAWFYPLLYDAFILAASRMWQNQELSDSTRSMARTATLMTIGAALLAFIGEFAPHGPVAMFFSLIIPAVLATSLVLMSRGAADRAAAEKPAEQTLEPEASVVPEFQPELHTAVSAPAIKVAAPTPRVPTKLIEFDPTDKRGWIIAQLDAGVELTGSMIDKKFGGRNGARTLKSIQAERAARNGHSVVKV